MAKWERDPVLKRRLAMLLAAAEAAALTLNFFFIFSAYTRWVAVVVSLPLSDMALWIMAIAATVLCLAGTAFQGYQFVQGRAWSCFAFLVENGAMILLGLVWFILSMMGRGDPLAVRFGVRLPLVTLCPLVWPLMSLRSAAPGTRAG
jgi:hypothetical protein